MRIVKIEGADPEPLGAPPDWNAEESGHCGALFVRREVENGIPFMRSAWEVEPSEAALLAAGSRLHLGVAGNCHPVVQLGISPVPEDFEPFVHARRVTRPCGTACVRVEMLFPYKGGRSAFSTVRFEGSMGAAIADGVRHIEELARKQGWIA